MHNPEHNLKLNSKPENHKSEKGKQCAPPDGNLRAQYQPPST